MKDSQRRRQIKERLLSVVKNSEHLYFKDLSPQDGDTIIVAKYTELREKTKEELTS